MNTKARCMMLTFFIGIVGCETLWPVGEAVLDSAPQTANEIATEIARDQEWSNSETSAVSVIVTALAAWGVALIRRKMKKDA